MRASLHSSNPDSYWSEALLYSVETTNRLPTTGLPNHSSPYKSWYGHRPSLRHLRTFGASCFAYIPVERRPGKLSPKGVHHKFLSYGSSTGVYRLLSPKNKVVLTKFVLFDETPVIYKSSLSDDDTSDHSTESSLSDDDISHNSATSTNSLPSVNVSVPAAPSPASSPSTKDLSPSGAGRSDGFSTFRKKAAGRRRSKSARAANKERMLCRASKRLQSKRRQPISTRKLQNTSNAFAFLGTHGESTDRPQGPDDAKLLPDWPEWQGALQGELDNITGKNTYTLVDRPPGANVIGTRWVLSKKFDADGRLVEHEARLVAQGYSQQYSIDFRQIYSPVVNAASLRLLLAISANKGYAVDSLDISTAFLNGDIDGDVYVKQPPGFVDPEHLNKVWKLNKALYGLKQSPRIWYMELHDHLLSLGFQRSGNESCLYARRDGAGNELMVAVYVDDLVISGSSSVLVSDFKRSLASKYDLTDQGELTQILGIKVVRDKRNKCFYLSQASFIKRMLS
ncbi:unnamed protein product, partial [Heterosigma akashiwo]